MPFNACFDAGQGGERITRYRAGIVGKSVVVSAYAGIPGLRLRITLAPDLQSGTIEAAGMHATNGMEVGLRASMTVSWTCPVLFQERYL